MKHLQHLLIIGTYFLMQTLQAQPFVCGVAPPNSQQREYLQRQIYEKAANLSRNDGTTCIPIRVVVVRQSDGTGGVTETELVQGLASLNAFYLTAGIEFFYCGNVVYVNNSNLYNFDPDVDTEAALVSAGGEVTNAVNVYCVGTITVGGGGAAGYAYLPYNDNIVYNRILMTASGVTNSPNGTFVHEFGHYFSLLHTHDGTESGNMDPDAENVPRFGANANCNTAGDHLCDTDADPRFNSANFSYATCSYTGSEMDEFNNVYTPPVNNIMSYYPDQCGGLFTAGQYSYIQSGLATRQGFSTYDYSCAPAAVTVPGNVTATLSPDESYIALNWADNANNEMGYLIEVSTTSAFSGFVQYPGFFTGPNATSFVVTGFQPATQYWFRLKPANGACNVYSVAAAVTTAYCSANSQLCDEYIARVQIGSIDNSTACSSGGFGVYTNLSTPVNVGSNYALTITNGKAYVGDVCGVWVDWNHDLDFDDSNETITVSGVSGGTDVFTATITPPIGALNGTTRMRIRITYNQSPSSCGSPTYGEVEDYNLDVTNVALPVTLTEFSGWQQKDEIHLQWETQTELNNDYFLVERAADGRSFSTIGQIEGKGTSTEPQSYTLLDENPLNGLNYYRLKQIDFDGTANYSKVLAFRFEMDQRWQLAPNPTDGNMSLWTSAEIEPETQFEVVNLAGKHLNLSILDQLGGQEIKLHCEVLLPGIYWLKITNKNEVKLLKFIKI